MRLDFASLLKSFHGLSALVVGDLMLDEYLFGVAPRMSPEAPVMVVRKTSRTAVPGGAANVAKNLVALGARTSIVGVVGDDESGAELSRELADLGIDPSGLVADGERVTTVKTRVLADGNQQVLRFDIEETKPLSPKAELELMAKVRSALEGTDVIVLSDYQKGVLSESIVRQIIEEADRHEIKVVANAKPHSVGWYRGAFLVSLNQFEAAEASAWPEMHDWNERSDDSVDHALPQRVAGWLQQQYGIQHVLVTLRVDGMVTEDLITEPCRVEVSDGCGAGDTTIATVALGLAVAGYGTAVFDLAARTAAVVVQKMGVAVPTNDDLTQIASGYFERLTYA